MPLTARELTEDDASAARQLGFEAFGMPQTPPAEPASIDRPGQSWFGSFNEGTLVAKMVDRDYQSYFGGGTLATSGIAGVTVAAEYRGRGALAPLFELTLAAARERGAVISTLFPTAPGIYRRFGYEMVAEFCTVQVPTHMLASVVPSPAVHTRRAGPNDVAAIRSVYDCWAAAQNGPLTRRGVSFSASAHEYLDDVTAVTVAVDANDAVHGYASWRRGQGYGGDAVLMVTDLLATDAAGYRALINALGSFSSVTPVTRIDTSGDDVARLFLPSLHWQVVDSSPYMLKILDPAAALTQRLYPSAFTVELAFQLSGGGSWEIDGGYLLDVSNGRGSCTRARAEGRTFTPHGLALLFAGSQSSANLRCAGHLRGGELHEDLTWDALFGGRQAHIRDYF